MRILTLLLIAVTIVSAGCAPLPHELGEAPFRGEISTIVYSESGDDRIIEKGTILGESNFYYSGAAETFLLNIAFFDSNETIEKAEWSDDGIAFAFLIANSTRFAASTRLAVYRFADNGVTELLDIKDAEIVDFRFAVGQLIYTDASGREGSVPVN